MTNGRRIIGRGQDDGGAIWPVAVSWNGRYASATALSFRSTNSQDFPTLAGAQAVRIVGLDGGGDLQTYEGPTGGLGSIALPGTWLSVHDIEVTQAGAFTYNAGNIIVRPTADVNDNNAAYALAQAFGRGGTCYTYVDQPHRITGWGVQHEAQDTDKASYELFTFNRTTGLGKVLDVCVGGDPRVFPLSPPLEIPGDSEVWIRPNGGTSSFLVSAWFDIVPLRDSMAGVTGRAVLV